MLIHESSIIHPLAEIDDDVHIGPFCIVGEDVRIKSGSKLCSHVVLKGPTTIGKNNTFYQFCTIGEDTPDKKFRGEKTTLEIGDNNIFREGVTVHRGTIQDKSKTVIGSKNLFMAYAHVAHDCIVGDDNVFANNAGIAGHVNVGSNVTIGALTTIHQFCQMGDYSFAGMNASITMDVPAYIKVASNPARVVGLNSVGMERGGIDQETITFLKKAYKIIYRKGFSIKEAIEKVESMDFSDIEEIQNFICSLRSSERGILR
tara:strand:- start:1504 stop:2280 length:777 start_codon:yes stop_codon:yes gene_type:complete